VNVNSYTLRRRQWLQPPVINDQQRHFGQLFEDFVVTAIGFGLA